MHGEEQRQRGAHRLFAAATQAAVLHLTPEQLPDDGLAGGAERAEAQPQEGMTSPPGPLAPAAYLLLAPR